MSFTLSTRTKAIDECAARGLPSIAEEETKTLVLSNGVLGSLQSTCDASNVVARLQDKLQIKPSSISRFQVHENHADESVALLR
ncbi:hypothetical protein OS493_024327 [Desmophyllum pertusum]|uniref:Uncharacterized protein n=1 Tax=Desmophyllum pertusum TaxID=174260 RepID=A0A9W9YPP2_9CNID|nr:hypothetical protein OS493_024327 [Desmophyllum pertusum]